MGTSAASWALLHAAGVPGELLGYWQAKQQLGNLAVAWEELVEPSI